MRTNLPVELVTGRAVLAVRAVRNARPSPSAPRVTPRVPGRTTPDTGRPVVVRGLDVNRVGLMFHENVLLK